MPAVPLRVDFDASALRAAVKKTTGLIFSLGAASAQVEGGPDHWHKIYQLCLQQQATLRIEIARATKEISTLNVETG
jgi:transposase